ncbi:Panacea domain-containing protein [Actinoplanes sp. CA-131856]
MLKADDVATVIISRSGPWIDAMSLQKLLYYVQAWHLAITDEPLFAEVIEAWKDGPVVPQVRQARRDRETRRARTQAAGDIALEEEDSHLIDLVLATYGKMSAEELSALTHIEAPWQEARGGLPDDASSTRPIQPESMARFYRAHRRLDGHTAAELAAVGIHRSSPHPSPPVDVDEVLRTLADTDADAGDNPWGSSNLDAGRWYDAEGIAGERRRAGS